jgi:hypothetical protein
MDLAYITRLGSAATATEQANNVSRRTTNPPSRAKAVDVKPNGHAMRRVGVAVDLGSHIITTSIGLDDAICWISFRVAVFAARQGRQGR